VELAWDITLVASNPSADQVPKGNLCQASLKIGVKKPLDRSKVQLKTFWIDEIRFASHSKKFSG
jgi:hypothetical protein